MIHIGLIGCGRWGKYILRDLLSLNAKVTVIAPSGPTRDYAVANGADAAFDKVDNVADVDGWVVATPSSTHAKTIKQLLTFKKPIFTEKPLTTDLASAEFIVDKAVDRIFVMDKWRYHPGINKLRELLEAGALGEPHAIRISRLGWGNPHVDSDTIWHLLPHDISIVLHLLGHIPPVIDVTCTFPQHPDRGVLIRLGDTQHFLVTIEISTFSPEHRRSFIVSGSQATAQLADSYETKLYLRTGNPSDIGAAATTIAADGPLPLYAELKAFIEYLGGGPPPFSSARDGLDIVRTIDKISRLAKLSDALPNLFPADR